LKDRVITLEPEVNEAVLQHLLRLHLETLIALAWGVIEERP